MKRPVFIGLILLVLTGVAGFAQESSDSDARPDMEQIFREALAVRIQARLFHDVQNVMWQSEVEKLTIPGRPVTVNMKNEQARLSVHFTPYRRDTGDLILVAHSEIWLVEEGDKSGNLRYFTSMKSIPLDYGEIINFYPLGKLENLENKEQTHIEMSLSITPYVIDNDSVAAQSASESESGEN